MAITTSIPSAPMGATAAMARTVTSQTGSSERGNGHTLIELLVVLLILAAATSVALPRLESVLPQLKLKQTAREVVLTLREAQRRAIQGGLQTAIRLNLAHRQLRGPGGLYVPLDPHIGPRRSRSCARRDRFLPRRHLDGRQAGSRLWRAALRGYRRLGARPRRPQQ